MLNNNSLKKYYGDVSQTELKRLQDFLATHRIKQINVRGKSVRYYSCGEGEQTILTFSGGRSGLETVYETILGFENDYRMVVVDISLFKSLSEFRLGVDMVLEREGVDRLFIIGQSLSGVYSQIYFKENYEVIDVDGVRILFGDGWGLVRASNTQPVLVLRFEAKTSQRLEELKNLVINKLKEFGNITL